MDTSIAARRFARISLIALAASGIFLQDSAAQDWQHDDGLSAVTLPSPSRMAGVIAAELRCAERRWSFEFAVESSASPAAPVDIDLSIDRETFPANGLLSGDSMVVPIEGLLIELLKSGNRLTVETVGMEPALSAAFSLAGSRRAIEAAEPLCSKRDMSGYDRLVLSGLSPAAHLAMELRKDEIRLFRGATGLTPVIAAEIFAFDGGRRLLFAEICGASSYYGRSGCNLAGFALDGPNAKWRLIYEAEGADIYADRGAVTDGWPDLVALPKTGGSDAVAWTWIGTAYALAKPAGADLPEQSAEGDQ